MNITNPTMVQRIERWPLDKLQAYASNARIHPPEQVQQIAASMMEFGIINPPLIGPGGTIIAGHARVAAALQLGLTEIPVIVLDHLTPAQQRALVLADNRLALNASWNEDILRAELASLEAIDFNLELIGFDHDELELLLADSNADCGLTDEDAAPELPQIPVSMTGDLWVMRNHRLLCGDGTVPAEVARLMAGEAGDLVFTDPPYNVDYQGYTDQELKIQGDRMSAGQFRLFLAETFRSYRAAIKPTASLYVCHASSWQREFQNALECAGFAIRCQLVWAKNTFAWGFGRYKFRHEPIFYCHLAGQKDAWYGDKSQSTLWEENKPAANRIHPTAKPVGLVERALVNSSLRGDIVLDLFGGSGSTLIACERKGRKARLMEIDARYVDCIVQRWEQYTGQTAVLEGDGRTFAEISRERQTAVKEAA
jgi:DNA modification methylase